MKQRRRILCGLVLVVIGGGCSSLLSPALSPRPDRSRFYVLAPVANPPAASGPIGVNTEPIGIGIGPIEFPGYLGRREIVTRADNNELKLSNRDRWAEPLDQNFARVVADNVGAMTNTWHVRTFPWHQPSDLDYQVRIDVRRFDIDSSGTAHLNAGWQVRDGLTYQTYYTGNSDISDVPQTGESAAATLSRATGDMTRQIADAIESVRIAHPPRPHPHATPTPLAPLILPGVPTVD
jgi:uncharacterized lipoprotein YmbA